MHSELRKNMFSFRGLQVVSVSVSVSDESIRLPEVGKSEGTDRVSEVG